MRSPRNVETGRLRAEDTACTGPIWTKISVPKACCVARLRRRHWQGASMPTILRLDTSLDLDAAAQTNASGADKNKASVLWSRPGYGFRHHGLPLLLLPLECFCARSYYPRRVDARPARNRSDPLHPAPENRPTADHFRGPFDHPPHRFHAARVRLLRRWRAADHRPAPTDRILLAFLHDSRNL